MKQRLHLIVLLLTVPLPDLLVLLRDQLNCPPTMVESTLSGLRLRFMNAEFCQGQLNLERILLARKCFNRLFVVDLRGTYST